MRSNLVKALVGEGKRVLNAWCSIGSSHVAEALAHQGFDSVTIDLQHGAIGSEQAFHMLQGISTSPAMPMARVPCNEPGIIAKLLDAGAYGLICPMVNSRRDAEAFVGAGRYPPAGTRSYGPNRVTYFAGADYWQQANREVLLLAQIETAEAVGNLDAILSVPGLDGIYVGPGDLSLSLGARPSMAPDDPRVLGAMRTALDGALAKGLIAGVHTDGAATALARYREGFHLCSTPTDMRLLLDAARGLVAAVKHADA
ncbi:MAG: HpcH/HpaI aldolase family protein [Hyphomicrobium sp.]